MRVRNTIALGALYVTTALVLGCTQDAPAPSEPTPALEKPVSVPEVEPTPHVQREVLPEIVPEPLPQATNQVVASWFNELGSVKEGESFGKLITRIAAARVGTPYFNPKQTDIPETLDARVDSFQCVSLVETSLSLARCTWMGTPTPECYQRELISTRYRDGRLEGYSSRLHYFYDWIGDNARRERMVTMTEMLGGRPSTRRFKIMTQHPDLYPALQDPLTKAQIGSIEDELNQERPVWIRRDDISSIKTQLKEGDIIGIVGNQPGLLIVHTGFATMASDGQARYLHASSHHQRVVLTPDDIEDYVFRERKRRGIVVARPLAP